MVCAYQIFFVSTYRFIGQHLTIILIYNWLLSHGLLLFLAPTFKISSTFCNIRRLGEACRIILFFFDVDFEVGWSSKFLSNWRGHSLTTLKLDFGVCTVLMCKLAKKIAIGLLHIDNYKDWPLKVITNIILIWNRILAAMHITVSFSLRITIFFFT